MNKKKHRAHVARGEFERFYRIRKSLAAHEWNFIYLRLVKRIRGPRGEHRRIKQMERLCH